MEMRHVARDAMNGAEPSGTECPRVSSRSVCGEGDRMDPGVPQRESRAVAESWPRVGGISRALQSQAQIVLTGFDERARQHDAIRPDTVRRPLQRDRADGHAVEADVDDR